MSKGKYSPAWKKQPDGAFIYNAVGEVPPKYTPGKDVFDEKVHFANYDEDGYDSYGYSAWFEDGTFIGTGQGIDRNGYTENDYLNMTDDEFNYF
jgi:hypothetical protein